MKLEFNLISAAENDDVFDYDVIFHEKFTVKDFIDFLLTEKKEEWGYVYINSHTFKNQFYEYRHGKTKKLIQGLFDKYSNVIIKKIYASGGWHRMDYRIFTENEELVSAWEKIEDLEAELAQSEDVIRGMSGIISDKDQEIKTLNSEIENLKNVSTRKISVFGRKENK